jgi:hypothetical protein
MTPQPPSLKEQALALLDKAEDPSWDINDFSIVRQALALINEVQGMSKLPSQLNSNRKSSWMKQVSNPRQKKDALALV